MKKNQDIARLIISLCDLTSLNSDDTKETIATLCKKAITPYGNVAAICIYPRFVKLAKKLLSGTNVKIATVCNFPHGDNEPKAVYAEIKQAIKNGADEIDLVIPYKKYLSGDRRSIFNLVSDSKMICKDKITLKVILETGVLETTIDILVVSNNAIFAGADFLKTSTGKVAVNATPQAARIMLEAIRRAKETRGFNVGFKAAGGIRTIADARKYLQIAREIMGENWITPKNFRFGASALLDDVLRKLKTDVTQ